MKLALAPIICAAPALAQPQYQITDLNQLAGGDASFAHAVNAWGVVVGDVLYPGDDYETAARWDGSSASLGRLPGDNRSLARDITNSGLIVGTSELFEILQTWPVIIYKETFTAVVWNQGQITPLKDLVIGQPPMILEVCMDADESGRIVGYGRKDVPPPAPSRAFLYDAGVATEIGQLPPAGEDRMSLAWAINESGVVVGEAQSALFPINNGHVHAFRWTNAGGIEDLHAKPEIKGLASRAFDVNDAGTIVGEAQFNVSHPEEPAVWHTDGSVQLLPNLGFWQGAGLSINERGEVAGYTFFPSGQARAVVWMPDGEIRDLSTMIPAGEGWDFLYLAWSINDTGQIAGVGMRHGIWDRAFLLTPLVCEPDCEEDGDLDLFDFLCYQGRFATGDPWADFEHDGDLDLFDFLAFQNAFVSGCD